MNEIRSRRLADNASTPEAMFWEIYAERLPTYVSRRHLREHLRWVLWTQARWAAGRLPVTKLEASARRLYDSAFNAGQ